MAQRERCASLIVSKGWNDAGHFEDVGKPGWDPSTHRPGLAGLCLPLRTRGPRHSGPTVCPLPPRYTGCACIRILNAVPTMSPLRRRLW
jgi:hypothetical protein